MLIVFCGRDGSKKIRHYGGARRALLLEVSLSFVGPPYAFKKKFEVCTSHTKKLKT